MQRNSGKRTSLFEEKMMDSRQLVAKDWLHELIKVVHEFLLGLGFPRTISLKGLHTTSTDDFVHVYSFGGLLLDSSFQLPTNALEGETAKLLKDLGFPVALSKSSMCLVEQYPKLLGEIWFSCLGDWFFNWQIVKMMCLEKESSFPCDVEEGAEFNKPLMEYCRDTYTKFVEAPDTIEKKDEALINRLLKRFKLDKKRFIPQQKKRRVLMEKNRLKREGCCSPHHNPEEQKFPPEDSERERVSEEQQQALTQWLEEIKQWLRNEAGGAKTQKSRRGKKVRRKHRK